MAIKLKLKPANQQQPKPKAPKLASVVKRFLDGPILEAIDAAQDEPSRSCVNVEVPHEAYADLPAFYKLCAEALKPLGYKSEESQDGGNMYNTLCVTWKPKKKYGML